MSSDFTCGAFPACFTACFISVSADHINASPSVRRLPAHAAAQSSPRVIRGPTMTSIFPPIFFYGLMK